MSVKTEVLQLKVVVDTKEGINNLAYLEEQYKKLRDLQRFNNTEYKPFGSQADEIDKNLSKINSLISQQRQELGLYGKTAKENQQYIRDMGTDLRDMIPSSDKAREFRAEIEKVREATSGKADAREHKFREIDDLRLMIKDSGEASLSLKQLEKVGTHLFDTMSSSAQSGAIETHQYYQEWLNINKAIKAGKETLDKQKTAEIAYNATLKETVKTQGVEALSLTHLREYYKLLKKEIEDTSDFESEANKKRIADSQNIAQLINKKEGAVSGTTSFFGQIKDQLPSAVAGAFGGMFVGLAGELSSMLVGAVGSAFDAIKKRARDITDIQVSLDTSRSNAEKIKGELNDIRTETSVDELKKLVEVAGDLNVATGDVKAFVTQADQFAVVMGDDFGTNIQESTGLVSKLKAEFKDTRDLNFQDALAKIGSTLKDLNLDGAATVPGITDFLKRVGALPDAIKPSLTDLAALGAVFEEANLTSEISGSGFSKILLTAANNADLFAKQMKMSKKEVENLINTNPNEFVIKFSESLKGLSGTDTAKTLKAVKLESDEVTKVVGVLTDNIDKLRQKQELANRSFTDGTTITNTFNKYLNDEAGQIAQIEKAWARATNGFVNWLTKVSGPLIMALAGVAEKGKTASEVFEEQDKKTKSLNSMLPNLVSKYETLSLKTEKTAEDQERLNAAMQSIGSIVPGAVSQYDSLGRIMKINLGIVNDFLDAQNLLLKQTKFEAVNEKNKLNNNLGGQRKEILEELRKGEVVELKDRRNGVYESRKLTDDEIRERQRRLNEINKQLIDNKKRVAEYNDEADFTTPNTDKKTPFTKANITGTGVGKGKGNDADARAKFLQDSEKQLLELQAKLLFEELQATADAEEKRINIANKTAEDEIKRIETQFKNQKGIILKESELSHEQKRIIHRERKIIERKQEEEVVAIYDEFDLKRQAQIIEQTNRAMQLMQEATAKQLQNNLKNAQRKGTSTDVFNAQEAILYSNQAIALANLKVKYDKEKEALKDNKKALTELEKNYGIEKTNIINQQLADWEILIAEFYSKDVERKKKANLDKLRLDVSEVELNGENPKNAKLALLQAEMQAELSVKDLTEAEKTNILRRYAQERQALERQGAIHTAEAAVGYFEKAFNAVGNIAKSLLQNRSVDEEQHYNDSVRRLDQEAEHGTLTARQHTKQKMALDKEHDKAQRKIKLEQFNLDKAANIANIIMQTALAVMKAAPNIPLQVITGVLGGVELGIAASQKPPAYDVGGALPDSFMNPVDSKGGGLIIAHPGEYMIPKWIRQSPVFANIEPVIEQMRLSGRSYDVGGAIFNSPNPTTPQGYGGIDLKELAATVNSLAKSLSIFKETLQTPITAHTAIGEEEIYKMEQERGKLNKKLDQAYGTTQKSLIQ